MFLNYIKSKCLRQSRSPVFNRYPRPSRGGHDGTTRSYETEPRRGRNRGRPSISHEELASQSSQDIVSGASIPDTWIRVKSNDANVNDSLHGKRCLICLRMKDRRRSKALFVSVNLSDNYGKHLAAVSLARRIDKEETRFSHRFTGLTSQLIICTNCHKSYVPLFKKLAFNPRTTNYYAYFEDVESDEDQPPSGSQIDPEFPTQATDYDTHQESSIQEDDFEDQLVFDGIPWTYEPAVFPTVEFGDYLQNDMLDPTSQQSTSSSDASQERLIPLYWRPGQSFNARIYYLKVGSEIDRCCVCGNMNPDDRKLLSLYDRWALIENCRLYLRRATDRHFLCGLCYDDGITQHCKDNVRNRGGKHQTVESDSKLKIANDIPQSFVEQFASERSEERSFQDRNMGVSRIIDLDSIEENECLQLTSFKPLHIKCMLNDEVYGAKANGLKRGNKLTEANKLMIYLIHLRQDIPSRCLALCVNVSASSILRAITDCQKSLTKFTEFFLQIPVVEEINAELTTMYAARIYHLHRSVLPLILVVDGSYFDINTPTRDAAANYENYSVQKKKYLRKTMTITTCTGHFIYSNSTWGGKHNDGKIMMDIVKEPIRYNSQDFVRLITFNHCILIMDRIGFDREFTCNS